MTALDSVNPLALGYSLPKSFLRAASDRPVEFEITLLPEKVKKPQFSIEAAAPGLQ